MNQQQAAAIAALASAIEETVNESPSGAPSGILFAGLMAQGMSREVFNTMTGILVDMGRIRRQGDVFFPVVA